MAYMLFHRCNAHDVPYRKTIKDMASKQITRQLDSIDFFQEMILYRRQASEEVNCFPNIGHSLVLKITERITVGTVEMGIIKGITIRTRIAKFLPIPIPTNHRPSQPELHIRTKT